VTAILKGKTSIQLPATLHRHRREVETCSTFFHCGAGDLEEFVWKHDSGRLPLGHQQFQKFDGCNTTKNDFHFSFILTFSTGESSSPVGYW